MSASDIVINPVLLAKIESCFNDPSYRELIENTAQFNSRLGAERTMRLPFLDSQTGVAQNHSNLFMEPHQRMPGMREGQIYTYPSRRWQKKRRQYLNNFMQPRINSRKENGENGESSLGMLALEGSPYVGVVPSSVAGGSIPTSSTAGVVGPGVSVVEEGKETPLKEDSKQDWYFDELDVPDAGEFDEPDADSDYDYEESYSKRKKKKSQGKTPRQQGGGKGGRRKINFDPQGDSEKPFACDICGARYKTRPGLTYHYTHSHKEKEEEEEDMELDKRAGDEARRRGGMAPPILHPQQPMPPTLQPQQPLPPHHMGMAPPQSMMHPGHHPHPPPPHLVPQQPPHMPPHHPMFHHQGPPPPGGGMPPPPGAYHPPGQPQGHMGSPHHQQYEQQQQHGQGQGPRPPGPPPPPVASPHHPGSPYQPQPQQQQQSQAIPAQQQQQHQSAPGPQQQQGQSSAGSGPRTTGPNPMDDPNIPRKADEGKPRVQPSSLCDFCLGTASENKKTGNPEELVSCSDCGRSGHPSCLQFTANMIISVKKYRWQCIECKCCSLCGTSDNDDQLLFCDDCDRGYHMYCLQPKLDAPPEGSWSCTLCLAEFHKK